MSKTVREMRMLFSAQAKGLRSAMKQVSSEIKGFTKNTVSMNKNVANTNKAMRTFEKTFKKADGSTVKVTGRIKDMNKAMKLADGHTLKIANRMKDMGTSATKGEKSLKDLSKTANRQLSKMSKDTKTLSKGFTEATESVKPIGKAIEKTATQGNRQLKGLGRETTNFATNARNGFNTVSGATLSLNNRLSEIGVGTGLVSQNFSAMETKTTRSLNNTGRQLSLTDRKLISVSGASLTLKNRMNELGVGTGRVAREFAGMEKQAVKSIQSTSKQTTRFGGVITDLRKNLTSMTDRVRKNFGDLRQGFSSISTSAVTSGNTVASAIRNSMIAPLREATSMAKNYAGILGLLGGASLANSGMQRLSAIENARVSLEVMLGDAEKANEFLDEILDFARTTPFAFPDLAETSRNLVAFGMDTEKVVPTMQAIGDAAAGSGKGAEGLNMIASAFGDLQIAANASLDPIRRLEGSGVPALKILANEFGITTDEMQKAISDGAVDSQEAIDLLVKGMQEGTSGVAGETKAMGGLMERMKDTWVGSVDSMKSSISSNMANLLEPIKPGIQSFMAWFGDAFGKTTNFILDTFRMMKPAAEPLKQAFKDIGAFLSGDFLKALKDVGQALKPIASVVGMTLVAAFSALAIALKDVVGPTISFVTGMEGSAPVIAGLISLLAAHKAAIIATTAAQKANNLVVGIATKLKKAHRAAHLAMLPPGNLFHKLLKANTAAMRALNLTMLKNPFVLITVLLVSLAAALYTAYKRSETFRNAVDKAFETIKNAASAVGEWLASAGKAIVSFFTEFGQGAATWFKDSFLAGLGSAWETLKQAGIKVSNAISEGIEAGLANTSSFFNGVAQSLSNGVESVSDFFNRVGNRIATFVGDGIIGGIKSFTSNFVAQLKEGFGSVDGALTMVLPSLTAVATRFAGLTGPVGWIITGVVSLISYLYRLAKTNDDVASALGTAWETVKTIFSGIMKVIQPIFDEIGKVFSEMGKELAPEFQNTMNVISESVDSLKPTFAELGETAGELGKVFGEIFSTLKETFSEVFSEIADTVALVVPQILPLVQEMIGVWLEFQKILWSSVGEIISQILPLLADVIKQVIPVVIDFFKQLIPPIFEIARVVFPVLLAVIQAAMPLILQIIQTALPIAIELFKQMAGIVLEIVKLALPLLVSIVQNVFPIIAQIIKVALKLAAAILEEIVTVILELAQQVLPLIETVVTTVFPIIADIIEKALKIALFIIEKVIEIVIAVLIPAIEGIMKVVQIVFPMIAGVIEGALNIVIGILDFFIALFTGNWSGLWDAIKRILNAAWSIIKSVISTAVDLIVLVVTTAWEGIKSATSFVFNAIWSFIKWVWNSIWNAIKSFVSRIVTNISERFTAAKNTISRIFSAVWAFIKSVWSSIWGSIRDFVARIVNAIKTRFTESWNTIKSIWNRVWGFVKDIWGKIWGSIKDRVDRIFNGIRDGFNKAKDKVSTILGDMWQAVKDKFNDIVDIAKGLPKRIGDGIGEMASKVMEGLKKVSNKMLEGLAFGVNGVIGGVNWVLDKIGVDESSQLKEWEPNYYKDGTKGHPGGPAVVGDGGMSELIAYPDGSFALSPDTDTLVNLPRGTSVLSGPETKEFMSQVPMYNNGVGPFGKVWNGMKSLGGKAIDAAKSGISALKDKASEIWDWAAGGAKSLMDKVLKTMGVEAPDMNGGFGAIAKGAYGFAKDKIVDFVGSMLPGFGDEGGIALNFPPPFRMTSKFNPNRKHPITGKVRPHNGIDFAAPIGTRIPAQAGGTVSYSGTMRGYGNIVIVKGPGGMEYRYAHNSKNLVSVGDSVKAGQAVALVGSTGQSTGPHVHFEVRRNGTPIDPLGAASGGGAFKGSGASGMVKTWIMQAINATGVPKSWLEPLATIAQKESGGNPRAINLWDSNYRRGTPSKGLMQTIDPTFNAYKKKGMDNIWNPVHNAVAAIRYIVKRYGSVFETPGIKSMMRGGGYKGYADGAIVDTAQLAWIAEGGWAESIISHDPSKKARSRAIWKETGDNLGFTDSDNRVVQLLQELNSLVGNGFDSIPKEFALQMDSRQVGYMVEPHVSRRQAERSTHSSIMKRGGRR